MGMLRNKLFFYVCENYSLDSAADKQARCLLVSTIPDKLKQNKKAKEKY
jgi:hypothetical protein